MKYYNIELLKKQAERLKAFLNALKVKFEISAVGAYYHFEILTDAADAERINGFLDNNTIWCKGV
jgi:5-hydroxyisourate hydrolase-like protein (transthyretin family)